MASTMTAAQIAAVRDAAFEIMTSNLRDAHKRATGSSEYGANLAQVAQAAAIAVQTCNDCLRMIDSDDSSEDI